MRAQHRKYKDIPLPPLSATPNEEDPLFVSDTPTPPAGPTPGPITPAPDLGDASVAPPAVPPTEAPLEDSPVANAFRQQLALDNSDPSWSAYIGSKKEQESGAKGAAAENTRTGAYGLFQIMKPNWEPWRKETERKYGLPEGSLADRKDAQNQYLVSRAKMQDYYDEFVQYGDDSPTGSVWGDVAAAWYTGGSRVRRAHRAKKATNTGQEPSRADARTLAWLQKMGKGDGIEKGVGKGEPWVGQYVDDVVRRMEKVGGDSSMLASSSMLVPDHEATIVDQPFVGPGEAEPPRMIHVPGRGFVAADDLETEKAAEEIQFQPALADASGADFVQPTDPDTVAPMEQERIDQLVALGMLDDEDTTVADADYGSDDPPEYVGTPPPPEEPADTRWKDADTQDALASTPDTDTDRRGSAGGWCAEGEIQIQGQCVNIAQMLSGLAENKQNLKELVKEEIKQLIISKNLDLKGNK
jgi:hypothetical protein